MGVRWVPFWTGGTVLFRTHLKNLLSEAICRDQITLKIRAVND